jgi:hypothetical protein
MIKRRKWYCDHFKTFGCMKSNISLNLVLIVLYLILQIIIIYSVISFSVIDSKSDNILLEVGGNKGTILSRVRWD